MIVTINGQNHVMSLSEAVEHHRKMWEWIAARERKMTEEENAVPQSRSDFIARRLCLKRRWLKENGFRCILNNCFCCEYDAQIQDARVIAGNERKDSCYFCPLRWSKNRTTDKLERGECPCELDEFGASYVNWMYSPADEIASLPLNPRIEERNGIC